MVQDIFTYTPISMSVYKQYKSETISVIPYILGRPLIYTSSLEVAQQVLGNSLFDKAQEAGASLSWGFNIVSMTVSILVLTLPFQQFVGR